MSRTKKKTEFDLKKEYYFKLYKSFKKVYCPALNDYILFTRWGWNHIVQKRGRSGKEQLKRLNKLQYVKRIILTSQRFKEQREFNEYITYRLEKIIDKQKVGIIIFKRRDKFYFVSII